MRLSNSGNNEAERNISWATAIRDIGCGFIVVLAMIVLFSACVAVEAVQDGCSVQIFEVTCP